MKEFNLHFYEAMSALDKIYDGSKKDKDIILMESDEIDDEGAQAVTDDTIENANNQLDKQSVKNDLADLVASVRSSHGKKKLLRYHYDKDGAMISRDAAAIRAAKDAANKFQHNEDKWPYQLQLLCNAYISESSVLKLIQTDGNALNSAVKELANIILSDRIELKRSSAKKKAMMQSAIDDVNKGLKADFHGEHAQIYLAPNTKTSGGKHDIDVSFEGYDIAPIKVEVKVVKNNPDMAKSFHSADIGVIIGFDGKDKSHPVWVRTYPSRRAKQSNMPVQDSTSEIPVQDTTSNIEGQDPTSNIDGQDSTSNRPKRDFTNAERKLNMELRFIKAEPRAVSLYFVD